MLNLHIFVKCSSFPVLWTKKKDNLEYCNLLKFVKTCFMAPNMFYPAECTLWTWEECAFCYCWVDCSVHVRFIWTTVLFKSCFFIDFLSERLSIDESKILNSSTSIVLLAVFPFSYIINCIIYYLGSLMLGASVFTTVISWCIYPFIII